MPLTKLADDLLPGNDPPHRPTFRRVYWTVIFIGWVAIAVASVVWGGVEPWEALGAIALGTAAWFLGPKMLKRDEGTRADDTSLREEIRQWQDGPDRS